MGAPPNFRVYVGVSTETRMFPPHQLDVNNCMVPNLTSRPGSEIVVDVACTNLAKWN